MAMIYRVDVPGRAPEFSARRSIVEVLLVEAYANGAPARFYEIPAPTSPARLVEMLNAAVAAGIAYGRNMKGE